MIKGLKYTETQMKSKFICFLNKNPEVGTHVDGMALPLILGFQSSHMWIFADVRQLEGLVPLPAEHLSMFILMKLLINLTACNVL